MDPEEFRDFGYLQEVNRQVLHPLGLALALDDGNLFVVDARDDEEGIYFAEDPEHTADHAAKALRVEAEVARREPARKAALGYVVQRFSGP